MTEVYDDFLDQLDAVYDHSENILKILKRKEISNCKELSKRVVTFKIKMIKERIMENVKKLEEFLYDSYKGFYCTICNYENHKFFNS